MRGRRTPSTKSSLTNSRSNFEKNGLLIIQNWKLREVETELLIPLLHGESGAWLGIFRGLSMVGVQIYIERDEREEIRWGSFLIC